MDSNERQLSIQRIGVLVDGAIQWLELAIIDLKKSEFNGVKEISWFIKRLEQFKGKLASQI